MIGERWVEGLHLQCHKIWLVWLHLFPAMVWEICTFGRWFSLALQTRINRNWRTKKSLRCYTSANCCGFIATFRCLFFFVDEKIVDNHMVLIFHLIKLGNHTKRWVLCFRWRFGICLLLMLFIKIYSWKIIQVLQIFNWFLIIYNWYDLTNK